MLYGILWILLSLFLFPRIFPVLLTPVGHGVPVSWGFLVMVGGALYFLFRSKD